MCAYESGIRRGGSRNQTVEGKTKHRRQVVKRCYASVAFANVSYVQASRKSFGAPAR